MSQRSSEMKFSLPVTAVTKLVVVACVASSRISPIPNSYAFSSPPRIILSTRKKHRNDHLLLGRGEETKAAREKPTPSTPVVEEVQPLTSASEERRLTAFQALSQQHIRKQTDIGAEFLDASLSLTDADALAMLLTTYSDTPLASDESMEQKGIARRRMGSVPGATRMSTLRKRAMYGGDTSLEPPDQPVFSIEDSCQRVGPAESLSDEQEGRTHETIGIIPGDEINAMASTTSSAAKPKRGRPRKNPLPTNSQKDAVPIADSVESTDTANTKVASKTRSLSNPRVTGGTLMRKRDRNLTTNEKKADKSFISSKGSNSSQIPFQRSFVAKGTAKHASIIKKNQRKRVVKHLPKSKRDKNGNFLPIDSYSRFSTNPKMKHEDERANTALRSSPPDSHNLNRYYKTELLTAKEEYSLGMKVNFMVKCEAVYEGLKLEIGRSPTIAEWANACGFDSYDAEMSSDNYVDNALDKQIRPSGENSDELDPNMFVGNGLVNDTGVGRGKGRARKPPPTRLADFHDDSFEKFKTKNSGASTDDEPDEEVDVFLYRQRTAPGQPINRGSPRLFREMMLTAKEAKQKMVQCNMRLVVSIARRYHGVGVSVQDLVQEGSLGLARAAEKFDPKKGFKFSTYASWWIQQAVFRSIAYHSRTIRLPVHVHNLLNKVRRSRQILQQELGRMPTNEELAQEMNMTLEKYNKMIRTTRNAISLERPKYTNNPKDLGHESEAVIGDMVDSSAVIFDEKTPEQNVDHALLRNDIQYMLQKLGEDERTVLCLRYGINDGITRTVTLVASEMRQTKSWVRSQECRALRKLRRPWYEKRLKEHRESLQASHSQP